MFELLLTQNDTFLIGDIAKLLGYIMEWIFSFTKLIGIQNFGFAIALFTIIVNLLMLPLTIKQQKFTRISAVMNPEIQAIQKKYKDKKDNESLLQMRAEMDDVYARYGVSQTGGCLQLLIQMPIFFALWRVISNIPAYVVSIKESYYAIIDKIAAAYPDYVETLAEAEIRVLQTSTDAAAQKNYVVDMLYQFTNDNWTKLTELFPSVKDAILEASESLMDMNRFIGDIYWSDTPMEKWKTIAILIPVVSGLLQWFSFKLTEMRSSNRQASADNQMANSMKAMNTFMPFFSAFICLTMACGLGLYWIVSSLVRIVIQLAINFYYDRIELQDLIAKNVEKNNKKRAKKGLPPKQVATAANINTRNISTAAPVDKDKQKADQERKAEAIKKATDFYNSGEVKPGSLAAKAQMVQKYNERNNKK